jgi:hypothetical protein
VAIVIHYSNKIIKQSWCAHCSAAAAKLLPVLH